MIQRSTFGMGLLGVAALGLTSVAAQPAVAVPTDRHQGLPGVITYQRFDEDGQFQLWVANADLTNERQLTSGPYTSGFATWKPDASRLAFDSNRSDPDLSDDVIVNDVFTMRPDGTDVIQVTNFAGGFSGDPDWSPDGQWLTFESDLGDHPAKQGIYVSRPDGTQLRRLSTLPEGGEFDAAPQFSPDGTRIVFTRYFLDDEGNETSALFIVNSDGTHLTELEATADLHPGDANWSPDGRTLVFEAYLPVFTIRPDGTHLRQLTDGARPDGFTASSDPVYSPDGRQIMLLRSERTPQFDVITIGLSIMLKNGQRLQYVTDNPSDATQEHQPDWILAPRLAPASSRPAMTPRPSAPVGASGARRDVDPHRR